MSVDVKGERYGVVGGSIQEILLGRRQQRSHLVQVLAVTGVRLTISDGCHVLANCVANCDISQISHAPTNSVIKIIKWSLVQLVRKFETEKPQYGIRLEDFEMVVSNQTIPVFGNPKMIRLAVLPEKHGEENLKEIVAEFLENIKSDAENREECKTSWAGKILNILKKSGRSWMCIVCKYKVRNTFIFRRGSVSGFNQCHFIPYG